MTARIIRILLAVILPLVTAFAASAQGRMSIVDSINASGTIRIYQPAALAAFLCHTPAVAEADTDSGEAEHQYAASATRVGYRVQIFDDNNPRTARRQAESANHRVGQEFPQYRTYLSFNSPYWRVKIGDFRTRAEAEAVLSEIRSAFPGLNAYLRVVRDKINVTD